MSKEKSPLAGFVVELKSNVLCSGQAGVFESCPIYETEAEAEVAAEEMLNDFGDDEDTTVIMYEVKPVASFKLGKIQKTPISF